MLRSLNRLVTPTGGSVTSELGELGSGSALRQHRRRTAMIFQHHQLIERQSALANVLTGRLAFHNTPARCFSAACRSGDCAQLPRSGRSGRQGAKPGGQTVRCQQQRVGIARSATAGDHSGR
ncbi:hypothetical protein [Klebsiella pneumoniae]|uniref:hypothetical protein n=1 Tax=Klebsiella pneumoniae TaxID=573 RepID=UPI000F530E88